MNFNGNYPHKHNGVRVDLSAEQYAELRAVEPSKDRDAIADLRQTQLKCVEILNGFARRIESGLCEGNMRSVATAFWSAAYALGLNCCDGVSMTERSQAIGVRRATISKGAKAFVEANHLPPSYYMKDENAGRSYCKARLRSVANGSNGFHV